MSSRTEWLLKALYEAAGELQSQLLDVGESVASLRPQPDDLSPLQLAGSIRDHELVTAAHLQQIIFARATTLKRHDLEWLEPEPNYHMLSLDRLAAEYMALRRQTCGLLWSLTPRQWRLQADHPFKGTVSVEQLAVALHEHDLEHIWRTKRSAQAPLTPQPGGGR